MKNTSLCISAIFSLSILLNVGTLVDPKCDYHEQQCCKHFDSLCSSRVHIYLRVRLLDRMSSLFLFLKECHFAFHRNCTNLHNPKKLLPFVFGNLVILAGVLLYFIVILSFISLMASYLQFFHIVCGHLCSFANHVLKSFAISQLGCC